MRKTHIFLCAFFILAWTYGSSSADTIRFALKAGDSPILEVPLFIDLTDEQGKMGHHEVQLFRIEDEKKYPIPCQADSGLESRIWFIPDQIIKPNQKVIFDVIIEEGERALAHHRVITDEKTITLRHLDKKILSYHHAICEAPDGKDPLYARSAFIHPLLSPAGEVLTWIQPNDHCHHYGVWNPWAKVKIKERLVDFWNLKKGQGTVRFAEKLSTMSGPVFTGFKVMQEHIDFKAPKEERIAINEICEVRAFSTKIDDKPVWIIDFTSSLKNALNCDIEFVQYRYGGGLGFRATKAWRRENCKVLTSEGKTRKDADGTHARWCDVRGGKDKPSGILFLSHTNNRAHPEPMRVWPASVTKDKGYLFFEFCPIRHESWVISPKKENILRYRMVVYDGAISPITANTVWSNFTHPPQIKVKK